MIGIETRSSAAITNINFFSKMRAERMRQREERDREKRRRRRKRLEEKRERRERERRKRRREMENRIEDGWDYGGEESEDE